MGVSKFGVSHCAAVLLLGGCSLIADSSLNYLKCPDASPTCLTGYTCRFGECVADASQGEGEVCSADVQCQKGLSCPPGVPLCAKPCTRIYDVNSECGPKQVCVPVSDRDNPGKFTGGACVPTECTKDEDCQDEANLLFATPNPANGCIKLATDGGLCLLRCQVGVRAANKPSGVDKCVSDRRANPTHCGRVATGDLICVPAGNLLEGQKCTLYPQSTSTPPDACGLNVNTSTNTAGLPLLCLDRDGLVTGNVRCRIAGCTVNATPSDCPDQQNCVSAAGLTYCRGNTEN